MPYARRYRPRRRTTRSRRRPYATRRYRGGRRTYIGRRRNRPQAIHTFVRNKFDVGTTITEGTTGPAFSFALSDFTNYGEFTTLFDQYRMNYIILTLHFVEGNVLDPSVVSAYEFPTVYACTDIDDSTPISLGTMAEREHVRKWQVGDRTITTKKYFIPMYVTADAVDLPLTQHGRMPRKLPWLDCANPALKHGCLKLALSGATSQVYEFRYDLKVSMSFRGVR